MTRTDVSLKRIVSSDAWFARQPKALQTALWEAGRIRHLARDEWLYGAGDEETGICAVLDGALRIEVAVDDRRSVLVNLLIPGIVIGQSRRLGGGPRIVTARAASESTVWVVPDAALQRISSKHPEIWRAVAELVYRQLADAMQRTGDLLALAPRERILTRLRKLAGSSKSEWVALTVTQSDVAEMSGVSRKTVSAHLLSLQKAGKIRLGYGQIDVRAF